MQIDAAIKPIVIGNTQDGRLGAAAQDGRQAGCLSPATESALRASRGAIATLCRNPRSLTKV